MVEIHACTERYKLKSYAEREMLALRPPCHMTDVWNFFLADQTALAAVMDDRLLYDDYFLKGDARKVAALARWLRFDGWGDFNMLYDINEAFLPLSGDASYNFKLLMQSDKVVVRYLRWEPGWAMPEWYDKNSQLYTAYVRFSDGFHHILPRLAYQDPTHVLPGGDEGYDGDLEDNDLEEYGNYGAISGST